MRKRSKTTSAVAAFFLCVLAVYSVRAGTSGVEEAPGISGSSGPTTQAADPFVNQTPVPVTQLNRPKAGDVKFDASQNTVEIHVSDASIIEVLHMLSAQTQKNLIASKDVTGSVSANLYGVTVKEALDAILASNGYAYREKGNFIFVYTAKEAAELDRSARVMKTQVYRLFYTPASNAVVMIKPVLSAEAQVSYNAPAAAGIASGTTDAGGNSHATEDMIVVTDYAENLDAVTKVLKEVDRRPQQILIEATIMRASLSEDNALGVDFNMLAGVKLSNIVSSNSQITNATPGAVTMGSQGVGSAGTGNSFSSSVAGGLKVGFVSDNVSVFLSALEGITDTVVLANPKILALNKQKGEVIVGRKDGYLTTTTTQTSTVQSVEFLDTGTRLIFRPYIGDDGYVRMEIHPEDSSGGLTGSNLPFKTTTEVTSNIMVKDGHTVVIGGLFRESTDVSRSQVPFLGNLPLAGNLFRQERDRTSREEIIILLTPHVIQDDESFSEAALALEKDGERLRVGLRQGMLPFGRERLAEMAYECAQAELKKPQPNMWLVNWHNNCATNLNPKFLEAIRLKEKLTGQEIRMSDSSSARNFVRKLAMTDHQIGSARQKLPAVTPVDVAPAQATAKLSPTAEAYQRAFVEPPPKPTSVTVLENKPE